MSKLIYKSAMKEDIKWTDSNYRVAAILKTHKNCLSFTCTMYVFLAVFGGIPHIGSGSLANI